MPGGLEQKGLEGRLVGNGSAQNTYGIKNVRLSLYYQKSSYLL